MLMHMVRETLGSLRRPPLVCLADPPFLQTGDAYQRAYITSALDPGFRTSRFHPCPFFPLFYSAIYVPPFSLHAFCTPLFCLRLACAVPSSLSKLFLFSHEYPRERVANFFQYERVIQPAPTVFSPPPPRSTGSLLTFHHCSFQRVPLAQRKTPPFSVVAVFPSPLSFIPPPPGSCGIASSQFRNLLTPLLVDSLGLTRLTLSFNP